MKKEESLKFLNKCLDDMKNCNSCADIDCREDLGGQYCEGKNWTKEDSTSVNPLLDGVGVTLKGCPFCGEKEDICPNYHGNTYFVVCGGCGIQTLYFNTHDEAVNYWNKRANYD